MSSKIRLFADTLVLLVALIMWAAPADALDVRRFELPNGAVLLVSEQHQLPMVTVHIAFDAGSRRDPQGKEGLARLTAASMSEGTRELSSAALNERIDFMGSTLTLSAGQDYAIAGIKTLKRYFPETLHLLAAVLTEPGLREKDVLRKRAEQIAALESADEQPGYVAEREFLAALFGKGPYGHLPSGTIRSVKKLTVEDVRAFYKRYYRTGGAVIAVVGDVSADKVRRMLTDELKPITGTVPPQAPPRPPFALQSPKVVKVDRDVTQANIVLGFGGIARSNPDFYRLQVMNYILGGGGFASRLVRQVRSKAGLAYSVHSGFEAGKFPGEFKVVLQTRNASAEKAIRMVVDQLKEIQEKPVTPQELEAAKKFLIGSFPLKLDRQSAIASFLIQVELYHLGLDYAEKYPKLIEAVTAADIQRVARQYLHPESYLLVAVANQKKAHIALTPVADGAGGA